MKITERRAALMDRVRRYGGPINEPPVMAQFLSQVMHESGGLRFVREIWGPTKAQRGYEGRKDLGNVQPGDGKRFMGRDVLQVTGRANYRTLTAWVQKTFGAKVDFEANPELLESPEWLGIGAIWYFLTRKDLLRYAREGNAEMVTRRVNGGLNGYADRLRWYDDAALKLLGHATIRDFQKVAGLVVDGISGPKTRAALHKALVALKPASFKAVAPPPAPPAVEVPAAGNANQAPRMLGTAILAAAAGYTALAAWFNDTFAAAKDWLIFWN